MRGLIQKNRDRIAQVVTHHPLEAGHIHLWWADLTASCLSTNQDELTSIERARCDKRATPALKQSYAKAHIAVNHLLSCYLTCPLADIDFNYHEKGKPYLHSDTETQFNFSHAGDKLLVAVTRDKTVGVDVELCRDKGNALEIAERFFSTKETEYLKQSVQLPRDFYRIWTAKEAVVKATGEGIAGGLDQFTIPLDKHQPWQVPWEDNTWWVYPVACQTSYCAAVASLNHQASIHTFNLTPQ